MLQGYKTYILAALVAVATGAHYLGYIDDNTYQTLLVLLGAGSAGRLAAKVSRMDKKLPAFLPFLLALSLFSTPVYAHTTPVVHLAWDYDTTLAEVQSYTQSITIDGNVLTTAPACVSAGTTKVTCSVPVPALATGSHNVIVSATRNGVTTEARINGLNIENSAPKVPVGSRVVITVTVNIGQ